MEGEIIHMEKNLGSVAQKTDKLISILNFINEHPGVSYYELKAYAFREDKHEWIELMKERELAKILSDECKAKKKECHINYNLKQHDAMELCLDEEIKYYARRAPEDMAKELSTAPEWEHGYIKEKYRKRIELVHNRKGCK